MKKILLSVFSVLTMSVFAQKTAVSKFFSEYEDREDFTQVQVTGKIFEMLASLDSEDEEVQEAQQLFENISGIRVIAGESVEDGQGMYRDAVKRLKGFELLMQVQEKDSDFSIMIDENGGVVEELVVVGGGDHQFVIVDVYGQIDLNQLSQVMEYVEDSHAASLDIDGENYDAISVYPNPVRAGSPFQIQLGEDMIGANCQLVDAKGKVVWSEKVRSSSMECKPRRVKAGVYVVELEKDGTLIRKKIVLR